MLHVLGVDVIHLREHWEEDPGDEVWIPWAASENRIILTADIARSKGERALVLARYGAVSFFFSTRFHHLQYWPKAEKLCNYWPKIEEAASKANPGDIFDIGVNGKITKRNWATAQRLAKPR